MHPRWRIGLFVAVAAVVGGWVAGSATLTVHSVAADLTGPDPTQHEHTIDGHSAPVASPPVSPEMTSLRGTAVDGEVHTDDQDHLVVSRGLRRFFDYILTTSGEVSVAQLRGAVAAGGEHLPASAQTELLAAFDRYQAYRKHAHLALGGEVPGHDIAALSTTLDTLHALRVDRLGPKMAEAFFGPEEAVQRVDLRRGEILSDPTLTVEARAAALEAAEAGLPESVRAARKASLRLQRLSQQTTQLREAGASPESVHAFREAELGTEAANRLAALDQRRAQWQARLKAFEHARDQILSTPDLTPEARNASVQELLIQEFSAPEQVRVRAQLRAPSAH